MCFEVKQVESVILEASGGLFRKNNLKARQNGGEIVECSNLIL